MARLVARGWVFLDVGETVGLTWAIWKNRNKMAIDKSFPSNPDMVLYNAINSLRMWGDLLKDTNKMQMSKMEERLGT